MRQIYLSILIAALASLLLSGCGQPEEVEAGPYIRPVKITELPEGGIFQPIELPGQIIPFRQANMAFEVSGRMTGIDVIEGQMVDVGDVLAKLDPRDYEASRDSALAQLENARLEAERAQALFDRQATPKQRLDVALAQLKVSEAAFQRALKSYEDTFLVAPISGVVAKIYVEDIVNVQAKQEILVIQDNSRLRVVVDVPETLSILAVDRDLSLEERTKRANPRVFLTSAPDRSYPGLISEISSMADPATRTYEGTLIFEAPEDLNVLPGMTAKVVFGSPEEILSPLSQPETTFRLPTHAVVANNDGEGIVWMVDHSSMKVSQVSVRTGSIAEGEIEVMGESLKAGDWIAISGIQSLHVGDEVRKYE